METDRANLRLVSSGTPGAADALPGPEEAHCSPRLALERLIGVRLLSLVAHVRLLAWTNWQAAACLYARGAVASTLGDPCPAIHGGTSRSSGEQSLLQLHP